MQLVIVNNKVNKFRIVNTSAVPPIGAKVDCAHHGTHSVTWVLWWPTRKSLEKLGPELAKRVQDEEVHIEAVVFVGDE